METVKRSGVSFFKSFSLPWLHFKQNAGRRCEYLIFFFAFANQKFNSFSRLVDTFNDKGGTIISVLLQVMLSSISTRDIHKRCVCFHKCSWKPLMSPSIQLRQGTDIGAAIRLAMKSFTRKKEGRARKFITDEEKYRRWGSRSILPKKQLGKKVKGICIRVGSPDGSPPS